MYLVTANRTKSFIYYSIFKPLIVSPQCGHISVTLLYLLISQKSITSRMIFSRIFWHIPSFLFQINPRNTYILSLAPTCILMRTCVVIRCHKDSNKNIKTPVLHLKKGEKTLQAINQQQSLARN